MNYELELTPTCKNQINKICKKNPSLKNFIEKKVTQILKNPFHFKPLRHSLAGTRRVHIEKSFVLIYSIDENNHIVNLLFFGHHDEAYRR